MVTRLCVGRLRSRGTAGAFPDVSTRPPRSVDRDDRPERSGPIHARGPPTGHGFATVSKHTVGSGTRGNPVRIVVERTSTNECGLHRSDFWPHLLRP